MEELDKSLENCIDKYQTDIAKIEFTHLDLVDASTTGNYVTSGVQTTYTWSGKSNSFPISAPQFKVTGNYTIEKKCHICAKKYEINSRVEVYAKIPGEIIKEMNDNKNLVAKRLMRKLIGMPLTFESMVVFGGVAVFFFFGYFLIYCFSALFNFNDFIENLFSSYPIIWLFGLIPPLLFIAKMNYESNIAMKSYLSHRYGAKIKIDYLDESTFVESFEGVEFLSKITKIELNIPEIEKVKHELKLKNPSKHNSLSTGFILPKLK